MRIDSEHASVELALTQYIRHRLTAFASREQCLPLRLLRIAQFIRIMREQLHAREPRDTLHEHTRF